MSLTASPAFAGVAEGSVLAQRWCAQCHLVSADQKTATEGVPSFVAVARMREGAIERFLQDPHPPMTGITLTREQIADLKAYIKAQAKAP